MTDDNSDDKAATQATGNDADNDNAVADIDAVTTSDKLIWDLAM